MRRLLACVVACLVGLQPAAVRAQRSAAQGPAASQAGPADPQTAQAGSAADLFGVSFERIKRELRILPPSTAKTPLKLEYYVEVQGALPPIPLFNPGELATGPAPYGAPTHSDVLRLFTPEEFRSPRVPVSSIVIMGIVKLVQWEAQRAREERIEKQRQADIEAERARQKRLKESIVLSPPK
jgi:hypothetical protein